jgi:hypothetical protein
MIDATPLSRTVRHHLVDTPPNDLTNRFQSTVYQKIACDIVVETTFDYPYPYISEKTLRPIACKRMFIIVGSAGTLRLLKEKGFMTFDDFVDESYDDISNARDRFLSVSAQIRKFCDRPLQEIVQYLKDNEHKLEHNFQNLMVLRSKEVAELQEKLS